MYRLLIVDDEPFIVEGLHELICQLPGLELEVDKAFSSDEAIEWISGNKADIVLTDIRMPGLTGIELQEIILDRWPGCKMIFLSGYDDFEVMQAAVRGGGVDYILKSESFDKIEEALRRAIDELDKSVEMSRLIERAKQQRQEALPMLQREFVIGLLEGTTARKQIWSERFAELAIPLSTERPALLIVGRVDEWDESYLSTDRPLILFAVQNIAEELLLRTRIYNAGYDRNRLIWLLQPCSDHEEDGWLHYVHGAIAVIQSNVKMYLRLSMSFALSESPVAWTSLSGKFEQLLGLLRNGLGLAREMIVTDRTSGETAPEGEETENGQRLRASLKRVVELDDIFEAGTLSAFDEWYGDVFGSVSEISTPVPLQSEAYYSLATWFLMYLNKHGLSSKLPARTGLETLLRMEAQGCWEVIGAYFRNIACAIIDQREAERSIRSSELIQRIHRYIDEHLDEELSLNRLSEVVYLNASYLSRVYKQITGEGLIEFINSARIRKSQELLLDSSRKILEVARMVGFESASYFSRVFRKETGMSPQEYIDAHGMRTSG